MCQVLNLSGFWIFQYCQFARVLSFQNYTGFTYFHKYDSLQSMHWEALVEWFWIFRFYEGLCQVSAYARLRESSEYAASSKYSRTLNMARLLIFVGYTGCWKYLSKSEYALTMSQYVLICLNNGEYGSFKYAWILNVSHAVHEVTWVHEVTIQITEQLLK